MSTCVFVVSVEYDGRIVLVSEILNIRYWVLGLTLKKALNVNKL